MKTLTVAAAIMFVVSLIGPLYAQEAKTGAEEFCNPKKMEECRTRIDGLINSLDKLRARLLQAKVEIDSGKKLTNEQAERLLKTMDSIQTPIPTTEGYLWDN